MLPDSAIADQPSFTDRVIVRLKRHVIQDMAKSSAAQQVERRDTLAKRLGTRTIEPMTLVRVMGDGSQVMKFNRRLTLRHVESIAESIGKDSDVLDVMPDRLFFPQITPNDPLYANQWNLSQADGINMPGAWDITTGSLGLVIAILDTGLLAHNDLAGRLIAGYDFVSIAERSNDGNLRDSDASDPGDWVSALESSFGPLTGCPVTASSWHGTTMAGVIAANANNAQGIAGINWNSKLLGVRVVGKCGGYESDIIDGLRWAVGITVAGVPNNLNPAKIINMSFATIGACSPMLQSAINDVIATNAPIVVAAGNNSSDAANYSPGNCVNVITVGAVDRNGGKPNYTNFGSAVTVSAPGGDGNGSNAIFTTNDSGTTAPANDSGYAQLVGTSIAAAHATGVASLLLTAYPTLTPVQLKNLLRDNSRTFPTNAIVLGSPSNCIPALCGAGILNAQAALAAAGTTSVSVITSGSPVAAGSAVTFSATVTGNNPTGTVTFKAGNSIILCMVPLVAGSAQCMATFLTIGTRTITAEYNGDSNNAAGTATLSGGQIVNAPTITLSPPTLASGTVNTLYGQAINAAGGTAPYSFIITLGVYPFGLSLTSGGFLSGTPNAGGSFSFTVMATDANGFTGSKIYAVTINPGIQTVNFLPLPTMSLSDFQTLTATASSGLTAFTFSTSTPSVCAVTGNTLNALSIGVCSVTATQAGDANYLVASANATVTILLPYKKPYGVAASLDGTRVFVTNFGGNSLSIIDTASNTEIGKVGGMPPPTVTAPLAFGKFIYGGGRDIPAKVVNDVFKDRQKLTGSYATATADSRLATKSDIGEQSLLHGGDAGGRSVWWTWTAPYTGRVTISTFGSDFDTLLGVYSGPDIVNLTVSNLTPVVNGSNDNVSATDLTSAVTFDAKGGQDYQIAVDGKNGASGRIVLTVWQPIYAYVADPNLGVVNVLDAVTNTRVAKINVGARPEGVAASPDGKRVYVANFNDGTVSIIDTATRTLVGTPIMVGAGPRGIAVSPNGTLIYVANLSAIGGSVSVIDVGNNNTVSTITGIGLNPYGVAFDPTGTYAYVLVAGTGELKKIRTSDRNVTTFTIALPGDDITGIAINEAGTRAYVTLHATGTSKVAVYNLSSPGSPLSELTVGTRPIAIAINTAGTRAYVANDGSNTVSILDVSSDVLQLKKNVSVDTLPSGVAVTPDGSRVYVTNFSYGTVSVVDTSCDLLPDTQCKSVVATLPGFSSPSSFGLFINPGSSLGAPTGVTAVMGDMQATITFAAPLRTGGAPITGYTAISVPGGFKGTCTVPSCSSITVTGLANGAPYSFIVRAINSNGPGLPSLPSSTVTIGTQEINVTTLPAIVIDGSGTIVATGGGSMNPVTFNSTTPSICTTGGTNGATVTGVTVGTCVVAANQAGSATFAAAPQVTLNIIVGKGTQQALTVSPGVTSLPYGAMPTLSTTGGSGTGAVTFTSNNANCTISGTTLTAANVGICIVTATKAADANYNAATATVTITITAVVSAAPVILDARAEDSGAIINFFAPTFTGGSAILDYTASCGPQSVTGTSTSLLVGGLINRTTYTCTVTARNAVGSSLPSSPPVNVTPSNTKTMVFSSPNPALVGATINFGAQVSRSGGGSLGGSSYVTFKADGAVISGCAMLLATGGSPVVVSCMTSFGTPAIKVITAEFVPMGGSADPSSGTLPGGQVIQAIGTVTLTAIQSRKTHGVIGPFDLPIIPAAITGAVTVEPRFSGAGHKVVFQYSGTVTSVGSATVVDANLVSVGSAYAMAIGPEVVVVLVGVPDKQRATVTVNGINGSGNASVSLGFLVGDVNSSRAVNSSDINGIKARIGQTTDTVNFRFDINASGTISQGDLTAAKARAGWVLP